MALPVALSSAAAAALAQSSRVTAIEGISPRVLSQTLNSLHRDGLIERKAYPTIPPRVEYTNTELGRSLAKAVAPLVRWAEENQPTVDANRVKYEKQEQKRTNLPL